MIAVVGVPHTVIVVEAQNAFTVVDVVLKTAIVELHTTEVARVGDVALTGAPEPVAVVHTGEFVVPHPTSIVVVAEAFKDVSKVQFVAVVGVEIIAVTIAEQPQANTTIVFAQED